MQTVERNATTSKKLDPKSRRTGTWSYGRGGDVGAVAFVVMALLACRTSESAPKPEPDARARLSQVVGKACRTRNPRSQGEKVGLFASLDTLQVARDNRNSRPEVAAGLASAVVGVHERCRILAAEFMDFGTAREIEILSGKATGERGWVYEDWALTEEEWRAAGFTAPHGAR